ncbi:MAG: 3-oxoadipate enol-lactonase [Cyclobacteriaceae bacterium]|nr:MAG: 3-oxoadipate enol-lactonase [Cyclobacteriaceae bacterium]
MPQIEINGCNYHYESHGSAAETLVLSHGLLWSGHMFHRQVAYLSRDYRVITYDHRGQGASEVTAGNYDMDSLYLDAVGLLEKLNLGAVHFGGLSMGGFVAMRLAARRPDLIKSLILMETSAQDEPNKLKYALLNTIVKIFGVNSVVRPVMKIMFGKSFLNDPDKKPEVAYWKEQLKNNQKTIVKAVAGVIERSSVEGELPKIVCPTLILVGTEDTATTPDKAEIIHRSIANSKLSYIEKAGHTACVEQPDQYNHEIEQFLNSLKPLATS